MRMKKKLLQYDNQVPSQLPVLSSSAIVKENSSEKELSPQNHPVIDSPKIALMSPFASLRNLLSPIAFSSHDHDHGEDDDNGSPRETMV